MTMGAGKKAAVMMTKGADLEIVDVVVQVSDEAALHVAEEDGDLVHDVSNGGVGNVDDVIGGYGDVVLEVVEFLFDGAGVAGILVRLGRASASSSAGARGAENRLRSRVVKVLYSQINQHVVVPLLGLGGLGPNGLDGILERCAGVTTVISTVTRVSCIRAATVSPTVACVTKVVTSENRIHGLSSFASHLNARSLRHHGGRRHTRR